MNVTQMKRAILKADYGQPSADAPSVVNSCVDFCALQAIDWLWRQLPEYSEKVDSITIVTNSAYSLPSDFAYLKRVAHPSAHYNVKGNADYEANKNLVTKGNFCAVRQVAGTPKIFFYQVIAGTAKIIYISVHPDPCSACSVPYFPEIFHHVALLEGRRRFQQFGFMAAGVSQQIVNARAVSDELRNAREMAGYTAKDMSFEQDDILWDTEPPP